MTAAVPQVVLVLWWATLALTVVVIVPVAVLLLHRARRAARHVQRYSIDALEASRGIAGNVTGIGTLNEAAQHAGALIERARALQGSAASLERVLRERTAGGD